MAITVFDPKSVSVGPIGPMMAEKVSEPGLKDFFHSKSTEDGNLSAIVIGDSPRMGVGVGTWDPGQRTDKPIPVMYDETLFIVEGSFTMEVDGESVHARQGEFAYIPAGSFVRFGSQEGCRLVWVTSPPTWVALEAAWRDGKIK